ncbi:MAG: ECF-type sigma factor [Phycisphaerales bacterium JB059]
MSPHPDTELTRLITAIAEGGDTDRERLFTAIYDDLRRVAQNRFGVGRPGDTLQATALVNETVLELLRRLDQCPERLGAESRKEFFGTVAMARRTILRDQWRAAGALKRGGGASTAPLEHDPPARDDGSPFGQIEYLELDEAIERLRSYDERWYRVVMLRFYAARTIEETALILGLGVTSVKADWRFARAWLLRELRSEAS